MRSTTHDTKQTASEDAHVEELIQITNAFLLQLDALFEAQDRVMSILLQAERSAKDELEGAIALLRKGKDPQLALRLPFDSDEHRTVLRLRKTHRKAMEARRMMPHSFLVSMVSQYDAFFSSAVRRLFLLRPEKIRSGDRSIAIRDLVKHSTIEEALIELVNDEVDEVLRGSHADQLDWLAKKFDFTFDHKLSLIQRFCELTERRNNCVHSDGRVSKYYVDRCKKLSAEFVSKHVIGEWVPISRSYLRQCRDVLFEVGLRAIQVAWRKARPDQGTSQASMLVDIGFELLNLEDYELAKNIGTFALELRGVPDLLRKVIVINTAIAQKFTDNVHEVDKILDDVDWSATETKFKLAVAVLKNDLRKACGLMQSIPVEGESALHLSDYRTWPLFRDARGDEEFKQAILRKFGEPLDPQIVDVPELELDEPVVLAASVTDENAELSVTTLEVSVITEQLPVDESSL